MATAIEIRALFDDATLRNRVEVGICIAAQKIASGNDDGAPFDQTAGYHTARLRWAASAIQNTQISAQNMLKLVLAANNGASVAAIQAATDATLYGQIEALVDSIARADYWDASEVV